MSENAIYKNFEADCGEMFVDYINRGFSFIERFKRDNGSDRKLILNCSFNEAVFQIDEDSTLESVEKAYDKACDKRDAAYKKSDRFREQKFKEIESIVSVSEKANKLLPEFKKLNFVNPTFSDICDIFKWFIAYYPCSDNIYNNPQNDQIIVALLESYGFVENEYVGEKRLIKSDNRIALHYYMGQAISLMKAVALHSLLIENMKSWLNEHGVAY